MKLPLNAKIDILHKLACDYESYAETGLSPGSVMMYKIRSVDGKESNQIARQAALNSLSTPGKMIKQAFDTRRVDQLNDRNPRKNLQYWHRSDPFIDEDDQHKLKTFAKLAKVLDDLKKELGTSPEWFESYARQLYDNVYRILRVKQGDFDIFRPQLAYLEQLIFARYRLSMENLEKFSSTDIRDRILKKDEELIGRTAYLKETVSEDLQHGIRIKDANGQVQGITQESLIQAIFGGGSLRKDGEKVVERTITITLRDNVIEKESDDKVKSEKVINAMVDDIDLEVT